MKVVATSRISHDQVLYLPGATLDLPDEQAQRLIDRGAAEAAPPKPRRSSRKTKRS